MKNIFTRGYIQGHSAHSFYNEKKPEYNFCRILKYFFYAKSAEVLKYLFRIFFWKIFLPGFVFRTISQNFIFFLWHEKKEKFFKTILRIFFSNGRNSELCNFFLINIFTRLYIQGNFSKKFSFFFFKTNFDKYFLLKFFPLDHQFFHSFQTLQQFI